MVFEKSLNTIFELHSALEHNIFKHFIKNYPLPDKLNHRHMRAIVILHFKETASMSEMSNVLGIEKGSFTTVAEKLIKTGYIFNQRNEKDRRVYELRLTEKGSQLAETFVKDHRAYITDLFSKLSEEEMIAFSKALDIVTDTIISLGGHKKRKCIQEQK